jgi:hypothetical protein
MPRYCLLDSLPVEILHILFTYFRAHDIFLTFSDVSDYINRVLLAYSTWQLNFKSIRRDHFDLICRYIQPQNVISLTLSDAIDTPGQSKLFFSHFQIEQFTHLRSLTLIRIEFQSIEGIFSNLDKLKQLISLSFNTHTITHKYLTSTYDYSSEFRRLNSIICNTYTRVLPQLNRLHLSSAFSLECIAFTQLRYLKIIKCWHDELAEIIESAPYLQSLDVCLELENPNMEITLASSQLTHLRLKIQSE